MPVGKYCSALRTWAAIVSAKDKDTANAVSRLRQSISKSCLLKRMIYLGEELRTRQCPIHNGEWSGCYVERCPAGCDTCGCACGWLPNDAPAWEAWGWTFMLAHAIDPGSQLPGKAPGEWMRPKP